MEGTSAIQTCLNEQTRTILFQTATVCDGVHYNYPIEGDHVMHCFMQHFDLLSNYLAYACIPEDQRKDFLNQVDSIFTCKLFPTGWGKSELPAFARAVDLVEDGKLGKMFKQCMENAVETDATPAQAKPFIHI